MYIYIHRWIDRYRNHVYEYKIMLCGCPRSRLAASHPYSSTIPSRHCLKSGSRCCLGVPWPDFGVLGRGAPASPVSGRWRRSSTGHGRSGGAGVRG